MARPFLELVADYAADPAQWEIVSTQVVSSTNKRNRGGTSVQELLRHRVTGEVVVRHTVLRSDGTLFAAPHFRPSWK